MPKICKNFVTNVYEQWKVRTILETEYFFNFEQIIGIQEQVKMNCPKDFPKFYGFEKFPPSNF